VKKLFILFLLLCSTNAVAANDAGLCDVLYELSRTVMKCRQNSVPIKQLLTGSSGLSEDIINVAYSMPLMHSKAGKIESINEFSNTIYLTCKDGFNK